MTKKAPKNDKKDESSSEEEKKMEQELHELTRKDHPKYVKSRLGYGSSFSSTDVEPDFLPNMNMKKVSVFSAGKLEILKNAENLFYCYVFFFNFAAWESSGTK